MPVILFKKSLFDDYFNTLYKIEYNYLMDIESSVEDYIQMDRIKNQLKKRIKNTLSHSINSGTDILLNSHYNRLNYVDFDDNYNGKIYTQWIYTRSKAKLYYYLLFEQSKKTPVLSECIDYWFSEGYGYFPDFSRLQSNHMVQNKSVNINILDPIGSILKMKVRQEYQHETLSNEEIKSIYSWELNKNGTNKIKYSEYINDISNTYNFFPRLPQILNIKGEEYVNLMDIFDIFFSFNICTDVYSNPNNALYIESVDKYPLDVIQLDQLEQIVEIKQSEQIDQLEVSKVSEEWISDVRIDIKPMEFIEKIKSQIEKLNLELRSTDNSGQRELKDNFLSDLHKKLNKYILNNN